MANKARDSLIVAGVLLTAAAIGYGVFLYATGDSVDRSASVQNVLANAENCKTNMKTIANAVQANHVRNRTSDYFSGAVSSSVVGRGAPLEDLQRPLVCRAENSVYTVTGKGMSGFVIVCGSSTHSFYWEDGVFVGE